MKEFIIAYDIVDKKRLNKISKYLEKECMRIQYSIYYIKTKKEVLKAIIDNLIELMEVDDDIRIYRVDMKKSLFLKNDIRLVI